MKQRRHWNDFFFFNVFFFLGLVLIGSDTVYLIGGMDPITFGKFCLCQIHVILVNSRKITLKLTSFSLKITLNVENCRSRKFWSLRPIIAILEIYQKCPYIAILDFCIDFVETKDTVWEYNLKTGQWNLFATLNVARSVLTT